MSKQRENYNGFVYQFAGGEYSGKMFNYHELEAAGMINGYSKNWSVERASGRIVHREELDDQPKVDGYLGPMYDGVRYVVGGRLKYGFDCTDEEKATCKTLTVIRYDTQQVYDALSR